MYSPFMRRRSQRLAQKCQGDGNGDSEIQRDSNSSAGRPSRVIVESPSSSPARIQRFSGGFPGTRQDLLKYVEDNAQILNSATGCDALRRAMVDWFPMLGNDNGIDYTCPICSCRLEDPAGCGHCSFRCCHSCLLHWCKKQLTERGRSSCPQCRVNIMPLDTITLDLELHRRLIAEPTFSQLVNQVKDTKQDNEKLWELVKKQGEEIKTLKEALNRCSTEQSQALHNNTGMMPVDLQRHRQTHAHSTSMHLLPTAPRSVSTLGQQALTLRPGPYSNIIANNDPTSAAAPSPVIGAVFPRLRFATGDRVLCRIGPEPGFSISRWVPGRVVQQWYRESPNCCAPYLVLLDDGRHTATPLDNDFVIRRFFEVSQRRAVRV